MTSAVRLRLNLRLRFAVRSAVVQERAQQQQQKKKDVAVTAVGSVVAAVRVLRGAHPIHQRMPSLLPCLAAGHHRLLAALMWRIQEPTAACCCEASAHVS